MQDVLNRINLEDGEEMRKLAEVVKDGKTNPEFTKSIGGGKNDRISLRNRIGFFRDSFTRALS
ncbi:hypothetical protein QFZ64_004697 [Streptomyces sp. B3I8]|nr:hypothetical protein [Streptomyces sp. B3I8]